MLTRRVALHVVVLWFLGGSSYADRVDGTATDAPGVEAARKGCEARRPADCYALGMAHVRGVGGLKSDFNAGMALVARACDGDFAEGCAQLGLAIKAGKLPGTREDAIDALARGCALSSAAACDGIEVVARLRQCAAQRGCPASGPPQPCATDWPAPTAEAVDIARLCRARTQLTMEQEKQFDVCAGMTPRPTCCAERYGDYLSGVCDGFAQKAGPPKPRAAAVRLGKPSVLGPMDAEILRRIVVRHEHEIAFCYTAKVARLRGATEALLDFTIAPDGVVRVSRALVRSTDAPLALDGCLATVARRWEFPKMSKESRVSYPVTVAERAP